MKDVKAIADAWNVKAGPPAARDRYWHYPQITTHVNRRLCGEAVPGQAAGLHRLMAGIGRLDRGISVGCGLASKEMNLLARGLVGHFDVFDLADARLDKARAASEAKGLTARMTFHCADAFELALPETYDLVYWNSALHHMPDAYAAVQWSRRVLKPGGWFVMLDFVGATRFQWSDRNLDAVRRFRQSLPAHLEKNSGTGKWTERPAVEAMISRDPSEAADSSNIIPAVLAVFPGVQIRYLGGAIYHFGLNGIFPNIGPEDEWVFKEALLLDDRLSELGENHRAACLVQKR